MIAFDSLSYEQCIQAVQVRDETFDDVFIFAVQTTGIYCRPSCSARTPNPENVAFFASPLDAQQAGYRACKRCTPDQRSPQVLLVEQACAILGQPDGRSLTLAQLADRLHMSPSQLHRTFKKVLNITPKQYSVALRDEKFANNLRDGLPVLDAALNAGYQSVARVYEAQPLGMAPRTYRKGGEHMQIYYAIVQTPLGLMLVAATEEGICFVTIADAVDDLRQALTCEFPEAEHIHDDQRLADYTRHIIRHLEGSEPHLDLPLDLRVTAFQKMVLDALRRIPYGETRTYTQVAESLGKPNGARAVARACATNPAAIVVPCHRVVRKDGGLAGYRWGLGRKASLLKKEHENT